MGTNYYLKIKGRYDSDLFQKLPLQEDDSLQLQTLDNGYVWNNKYYEDMKTLNKEYFYVQHIGKKSAGWNFALRGLPKAGIVTLDDWEKLFNLPGSEIRDEYDRELSAEGMVHIITNGKAPLWDCCESQEQFEAYQVEKWNERYDKEQIEKANCGENDLFIPLHSRKVKDYEDFLTLKEWGPAGAVRGARGLLGRKTTNSFGVEHKVIHIDGASYDISLEDANYSW